MIIILIILLLIFFTNVTGASQPTRLLGFKREKYENMEESRKRILHLGQRKLLFCEIEFLCKYPGTILYVGAGPGYHSDIMAEMFPDCKFIFYDKTPFYEKLSEYQNIELHNEYFTDTEASKYAHKKLMFWSDIRLISDEKNVELDMNTQMNWCKIIKPKMAMLKFRLPWGSGTTQYFDGQIYTQPRIGGDSTETRLWTDCKKMKKYDHDDYNDRICYFHKHTRIRHHKMNFPEFLLNTPGLCDCHDCWSELTIFTEYMRITGSNGERFWAVINQRFPLKKN